jgi:hypothetical protein
LEFGRHYCVSTLPSSLGSPGVSVKTACLPATASNLKSSPPSLYFEYTTFAPDGFRRTVRSRISRVIALTSHNNSIIIFGSVDYVLYISTAENKILRIEIEEDCTPKRWFGEFSAQYIEEITHMTGNFKTFNVFLSMLLSSLEQNSDSVLVDLLTYADLELLKSRRAGKPDTSVILSAQGNKKRYLILTYTVEFDRVHYPLPLAFVDHPSTESLQRTIDRLRMRSGEESDAMLIQDIEQLREENKMLRKTVSSNAALEEERDQLCKRVKAVETEFAAYQR